MLDLILRGHTVEHFECSMTPEIASISDDSDITMSFECRSGSLSDQHHAILRVELIIKATNPGQKEAFAQANAVFHIAFESLASASNDDLINAVQSSGIQLAMPLIRAIIVGATNMLGFPDVFSFPSVDYSKIEWNNEAP